MSLHPFSFPNTSHLDPLWSSSFLYPHFDECSKSAVSSAIFTAFTCTSFLLLVPLSAAVLVTAAQRWLKQRRTSTARAVSNSDFLAYNIIAMEPIGLLGSGYYCGGIYMEHLGSMRAGVYIVFIVYIGRLLFQCLTCVEQYLAVLHPVTYRGLRTERGLRLRNIGIGCIWLLCLGVTCLLATTKPDIPTTPFFTMFALGLLVITFCSFSVIFTLFRPRPGEVGGDRKRVDQSKMRALVTILAITAVMFLKYVGLLVCTALHASSLLESDHGCVVLMLAFWFCLPSSLSLPLLFLYRAGKLPCLSHKAESG